MSAEASASVERLAIDLATYASAGGVNATLAALVGAAGGTTARPGQVVVGRRGDIVVDHPFVSREHVAIGTAGEVLIAADLGSKNGTWLRRGEDRHRIASVAEADRTIVVPGDHLETIEGVTLLVVPAEEAVARPA